MRAKTAGRILFNPDPSVDSLTGDPSDTNATRRYKLDGADKLRFFANMMDAPRTYRTVRSRGVLRELSGKD